MKYFIYILYSTRSDRFYIGYTSNVQLRLKQHNTQEYFTTYTSKHRPWTLSAAFEVGENEKEAIRLERLIKSLKNRSVIEKLCDANFIPGGKLAQLVIPH